MTSTNKILPVALVAALLGGTVGAFVMRPSNNTTELAKAEAPKPLVAGQAVTNPNDESKNLLNKWAGGPAGALLTEEASAALRRSHLKRTR